MEYDEFRKNLKDLIVSHGYTPRSFALAVGISPPTISRYLTGERKPDLEYVIKIAQFFSVSTDWILGINYALADDNNELLRKICLANEGDKVVIKTILKKYV